jgi:actin-related protein
MPFLSFDGADTIATFPSIKKKVCHDDTLTHPKTIRGQKEKEKEKVKVKEKQQQKQKAFKPNIENYPGARANSFLTFTKDES